MALLDVITIPDDRLKQKCEPVEDVNEETQKIMDDMLETMYHNQGIGLAAIQVNITKQIIVIDLQIRNEEEKITKCPLFLINPKILNTSEEQVPFNEGCLSVPGEEIEILRPKAITVEYLNYNGEKQTLEDDGLLARVIQHEIDHLNGVLIINHASKLKRDIVLKRAIKRRRR